MKQRKEREIDEKGGFNDSLKSCIWMQFSLEIACFHGVKAKKHQAEMLGGSGN